MSMFNEMQYNTIRYDTILYIFILSIYHKGPSIKYVTLQREEGVWESVTVCDRGGGKDHVTSHFPFFRNSQFHVLFYILSCIIQI